MTFSIVARSDDGHAWGVAVASKFLATGNAVPAARAGVGALATQADANVAWKRSGLRLLADGLTAQEVVDSLVAADADPRHRQLGVVDVCGGAATFTGEACLDWAGGLAAPGVAIQGNILAGESVVREMSAAWLGSAGDPFAHRLVAALAAGDAAGGDRRGRQSAALLVVREGAGYGGMDDVAVNLRVDDHPQPLDELNRLLELNDFYLTRPDDSERVSADGSLVAELDRRAHALGHPDFAAWVGTENYEMRVAEDLSWVDRRVLAILRGLT